MRALRAVGVGGVVVSTDMARTRRRGLTFRVSEVGLNWVLRDMARKPQGHSKKSTVWAHFSRGQGGSTLGLEGHG